MFSCRPTEQPESRCFLSSLTEKSSQEASNSFPPDRRNKRTASTLFPFRRQEAVRGQVICVLADQKKKSESNHFVSLQTKKSCQRAGTFFPCRPKEQSESKHFVSLLTKKAIRKRVILFVADQKSSQKASTSLSSRPKKHSGSR